MEEESVKVGLYSEKDVEEDSMKVGLYGEKDVEEAGGGGKHEGWLEQGRCAFPIKVNC